MAEGLDVIYQSLTLDKTTGFIGYSEFLTRHESEEYQPADAKLSLSE